MKSERQIEKALRLELEDLNVWQDVDGSWTIRTGDLNEKQLAYVEGQFTGATTLEFLRGSALALFPEDHPIIGGK